MKLYWSPGTRAIRTVWMLQEAGLDYERVSVDLSLPERNPEFLAASPMGKVPALSDGDVSLRDRDAGERNASELFGAGGVCRPLHGA